MSLRGSVSKPGSVSRPALTGTDEGSPTSTLGRTGGRRGGKEDSTTSVSARPPSRRTPWYRTWKFWAIFFGSALFLLLLFLAMLPTMLGMGMVRRLVLNQVNDSLAGKVVVEDWSFGWITGVKVKGVRVEDDTGNPVIEVGQIKVDYPLAKLLVASLHADTISIRDVKFDIHLFADGTNNLQRIAKPASPETPQGEPKKIPSDADAAPMVIPDVSAVVKLDGAGRVTLPTGVVINVESVDLLADASSWAKPVATQADIKFRVADCPTLASASVKATCQAWNSARVVDARAAKVTATVDVSDVDVGAWANAMSPQLPVDTSGNGSLTLAASATGTETAELNLTMRVRDVKAAGKPGGPAAQVDLFRARELRVPLRVKLEPVPGGSGGKLILQEAGLWADQDGLSVTGEAAQADLERLMALRAPYGEGSMTVTAKVPQLPERLNTLLTFVSEVSGGGEQLARVASASFEHSTSVRWNRSGVTAKTETEIAAMGERLGSSAAPFSVDPVRVVGDVKLLLNDRGPESIEKVALELRSGFATVVTRRAATDEVSVISDLDLERLLWQVRQFVSLEDVLLGGKLHADLRVKGIDPDRIARERGQSSSPALASPVSASFELSIKDLIAAMGRRPAAQEKSLTVIASATLEPGSNTGALLSKAKLALRSSLADADVLMDSPTDVTASATARLERATRMASAFADGLPAATGELQLDATLKADPRDLAKPASATATVKLTDLALTLPGATGKTALSSIESALVADVGMDKAMRPERITVSRFSVEAKGGAGTPRTLLTIAANARADLVDTKRGQQGTLKLEIPDVPALVAAVAPGVPGLAEACSPLASGAIRVTASAEVNSSAARITGPATIDISNIRITAPGVPDDVALGSLNLQIDSTVQLDGQVPREGTLRTFSVELLPPDIDAQGLHGDAQGARGDAQGARGDEQGARANAVRRTIRVALADKSELRVSLAHGMPTSASGSLEYQFDISRLANLAAALSPTPPPVLPAPGAELVGKLSFSGGSVSSPQGQAPVSATSDARLNATITGLTVGKIIDNEKIDISAAAKLTSTDLNKPGQRRTSVDAELAVNSQMLSARLMNARASAGPAADPTGELTFFMRVPSLSRAFITARALGIAPANVDVGAGDFEMRLVASRDERAAGVKVDRLNFNNLDVRMAGKPVYRGDIKTSLDANVEFEAPQQPATAPTGIAKVEVNRLSLDAGPVSMELMKPILVRDPSKPSRAASGGLSVKVSDLGAALELASAAGVNLNGLAASGALTLTQELSVDDKGLSTKGALECTDLVIMRENEEILSRQAVNLTTDVSIDPRTDSVSVNSLAARLMPLGFGLSASGSVQELSSQRKLNLEGQLDYDARNLLELAQRVMSPEQRAQLRGLSTSGTQSERFRISGSYPSLPDPKASLRQLEFDGAVSLDEAQYQAPASRQNAQAARVSLRNLVLPLSLRNGILQTKSNSRPDARPADLASGKLDLLGISVDVASPEAVITIPAGKQLLTDVPIDPKLAGDLGSVLPLFANAQDVSGLVTVTVVQAQGILPSRVLSGPAPAMGMDPSGVLKLSVTARELNVLSPTMDLLLSLTNTPMSGGQGSSKRNGTLNPGDIKVDHGVVDANVVLVLEGGQRITSSARFRLSDKRILPLPGKSEAKMYFALDRQFFIGLQDYLPDMLSVPFTGTVDNPQPDTTQVAAQIAAAVAKAKLKSMVSPGNIPGVPKLP